MKGQDHILPSAFVEQMADLLGPELETFLEALRTPPPVSIRLNPAKPFVLPEPLEGVPWCREGFYLPERRLFTLDPLFHAGSYYVQEASSMLIGQAVRQLVPDSRPVRALDLCAAPGGKSTLLATLLPAGSLLLCNEVIRSRYQILRENLVKWGSPFTHTAQHDSSHFEGLDGFFDFILVDAPCSGEGLFRKDAAAIAEWSPESVRHCAARQKRILAEAVDLLAPGGRLCYSTCTYNELENSANARWLMNTFALEEEKLETVSDWGVAAQDIGHQCYPHRVKGEGLYLSCFRKTASQPLAGSRNKWKPDKNFAPLPGKSRSMILSWLNPSAEISLFHDSQGQIYALPAEQETDLLFLRQQLRKTDLGVRLGSLKRNDFVPSPDLALSSLCGAQVPRVELSLEQSLHYLKKENIHLDHSLTGWALVFFQDQPLGWIKGLGNRINNYYPKEWRIRMRLDEER